jgi:nucleotide-binding universal stress UspA family protein
MYRNVMVPVDGSPFSREAVVQGLRIASQSGAALHLVRVSVAPVVLATPEALAFESSAMGEIHSAELSELYGIAAECRAHSEITVSASVERGPVVDALIGYAKRHQVDLIVMRSHGRTGIARVWFGSAADGLIRESGIPVLVVRAPSVGTALAAGFHFKRILVPLDGSGLAEQAIAPAFALAAIDGASVTLLRIVTAWKHSEPGEIASAVGPASAQAVSEAESYLDSIFPTSIPRTSVSRRVVIASDIASAIHDIAELEETDLVALATRGHGGIKRVAVGSVSDQVMRESAVSTLVVHPAVVVPERAGLPVTAQNMVPA